MLMLNKTSESESESPSSKVGANSAPHIFTKNIFEKKHNIIALTKHVAGPSLLALDTNGKQLVIQKFQEKTINSKNSFFL